MNRASLWFALVSYALTACASLCGQGDRGVLRGTVRDASGAVVPNASVLVVSLATNVDYRTTTSAAGDFTVPSLPTGGYRLRVESPGFKAAVQDNIAVQAGDTVSLDLRLEVGATQETVQVVSEAGLLQTDTARVATQISTKFVSELPVAVNGSVRSPFDLAGVTGDVTTGTALRVGGGRAGAFGMTLDGTSITVGLSGGGNIGYVSNNTPSLEALAEFAVESNGFKAESGHASGGSVTFVSKSGTNDFHGSVYEFFRNEALDARGFFAAKKPVLKQNDFGFTAGGPVMLPKVYRGRDKTFFFFSYEGFRNRAGASATPFSVPAPEMFNGDFSNWVDASGRRYTIYDPTTQTFNPSNNTYTRTPFPNNVIPASIVDPIARPILAFAKPFAAPNVANLAPGTSAYVRNNYISRGSERNPNNKWSMKFDQVLTSNQRINFYYGYGQQLNDFGPNGPTGLAAPLSGTPSFNRSGIWRSSYDYTIRPTLLNRLYVGVNRFTQNRGSLALRDGAPLSDGLKTQPQGWKSRGICIPNYPDCDVNFPQLNFSNEFTSWGGAATAGSDSNILEIRNDTTWIKGEHTFKGGFFFNNTLYDGFGTQNIAGNTSYSFQSTGLPGVTSQATGGGSAFASFLLGQVNGYSLDTARFIGTHHRSTAAYFQDDWRVNPRLTLNLGLRFESSLAPIVEGDQQSELDFNLPNPAADNIKGALIFAGTGKGRTGSRTMVPGWFRFAPRTGFAYGLNGKITIRGSAGLSFGPVVQAANASHNLGFVQRITATSTSQGLTPLWTLKDGAPYWSQVPNIDPSVGNGANAPYWVGASATKPSQELNYALDIQRQVTNSVSVDVGYVGTMASRIQSSLLTFNALNYPLLPANLNPFTASGRTLLNSLVGSVAANAAGIRAPFSAFNSLWGTGATVAQALRPFPQYATIDTNNGGGDRIGHSTYHALQLRFTKRLSRGVTLQGQYNFSKYLTDYDSAGPMDPRNRRLEKALATTDQTHVVKAIYSVELPFGKGRRFANQNRLLDALAGGWRLAGSNSYTNGPPIAIGTTVSFPLFAGPNHPTISTYEGWRGPENPGGFDPFANNFFQPVSFFGTQPTDRFGNATRTNPRVRDFAFLNENVSVAKSFPIHERTRIEFRGEAFNVFNRTQFGGLTNSSTLQNANFGKWQAQANSPRQMQLTLKLSW